MTSRARATSAMVGSRTPDSGSTSGSTRDGSADRCVARRRHLGVPPAAMVPTRAYRALTRYSPTSMLDTGFNGGNVTVGDECTYTVWPRRPIRDRVAIGPSEVRREQDDARITPGIPRPAVGAARATTACSAWDWTLTSRVSRSDIATIPMSPAPSSAFNAGVIEATADLVCAFKPNLRLLPRLRRGRHCRAGGDAPPRSRAHSRSSSTPRSATSAAPPRRTRTGYFDTWDLTP